ncbi:hypothetical protein BH10ACT7_BH10ACT7_24130 [soil metagenome]
MRAQLRLAGISALVAGLVHLLQFASLGVGGLLVEERYPDPASVADGYWFGVVGTVTFTIIGLAYLVFFSAATDLAWGRTGNPVWRRAAQSAATIGIAGWLLAGANNLAYRGFNAAGIAEAAGGDSAAGAAALQSTYVTQSAASIAMAIAFGAWLVAFAVQGRRAGAFGMPTAILTVIVAVIPVLGWLLNVGGVPVIILYFFVLAPVLLRNARAVRNVDSAPVAVAQ